MKPVIALGDGWYSFKEVPQEGKYIKIEALNCGTDRKALNRAKRINPTEEYEIVVRPQ